MSLHCLFNEYFTVNQGTNNLNINFEDKEIIINLGSFRETLLFTSIPGIPSLTTLLCHEEYCATA